jgi:SNF2 family DNA or RNA helicase/tetratricopeptide (TPR) repeat protein
LQIISLSAMTISRASDVNVEQVRDRLVKAYRQLTKLEQEIIQLSSVIYGPVNRTVLLDCLNQTGTRDSSGKPFTGSSLRPYLERLLQAELLTQERNQGPQCHPLLVEIATRDAIRLGRFDRLVQAIEAKIPIHTSWKGGPRYFSSEAQLIREVRIGLYRQDLPFISKQLEDFHRYGYRKQPISLTEILHQVCTNPFDSDWFRTLKPEIFEIGISSILMDGVLSLSPKAGAFALLQESCSQTDKPCSHFLRLLLAEQLVLRGQLQAAEHQVEQVAQEYSCDRQIFLGWINVLRGNYQQAIADYTEALKVLKKESGKRKVYFNTLGGVFFILALLKEGSGSSLQQAEEYTSVMTKQSGHWLAAIYSRLQKVVQIQQGDLSQKEALVRLPIAFYSMGNSLETWIHCLCLYWADSEVAAKHLPRLLEPYYQAAESAGYAWLAMEAGTLLARIKPRHAAAKQSAALCQSSGMQPLVDVIQPQESWEICLKALTNLHKEPSTQTASPSATDQRLAWFVTYSSMGLVLQPREQKVNTKGIWSAGRPIALKRLVGSSETLDYLTPQDRQVCSYIEAEYYGYRGQKSYYFNERAIAALVGHPLVFWEDAPTTRVEVVKGEPELIVKKNQQDRLVLELSPRLKENRDILVVKETPTRLKVVEITSDHRRIAEILGSQNQLEVPEMAKDQVLGAINAVSGFVTVHSDIGGGVASAETVPADAQPHFHLLPAGTGLKVALLSRPFAQGGPYYRPGKGGETVIAEIDGKRLQTSRNLKQEKKLANAALAACPTLQRQEEIDGEWLVPDPEDCLEILLELQNLGNTVIVEWPEGEKMRVSHQVGLNQFRLNIQQQRDWFAASGELQLDDNQVLDMQRLLELLEQTPGRFVPLGNGEFLALTQEFRKRLDELRAFSEKHGKGTRFHPLAALAMEDWLDEVGELKADKHWKAHIQRLKEMQNLQPELPSTLQAELRDYQIDGFRWLFRLAHWGVGACLADDMGLGKTLQALAVILTRATEGPTLVVAPTSVGMNWIAEAERFAPTLNVIQFGSGDRQKVLDQLQPFDLLVCSYGLLQQAEVAEMLSKVEWQTIVLDEAQAIKNIATKRSQAAMNLKGGFKLITTGTPIENHLGELWNLFRFINPGLLGSLENFNQRFAYPIERYQDKAARQQLKKLVQPFLLRRTKSQVLAELPPRTEILLHVELSQEEMAFYEALRREAIAKLASSDAAAGQKHLQVLAEIMRLRRACCNARLVLPGSTLPSSKLQLFGEVLTELLDNRHKVLVFSQFVDHLQIIRDYLDQQQVRYQYLDGSTPVAERKKRVNAFQAGEGEVFLISLKAGGTGLNLTAADYVIHMDPWWNPAVEDQASDRAHRIGQQRPVTIYRLVAKNTIEDKIVDLHQHKRDLADSLLEGADISGKMSTDELLQFIQEG